MADASAPRDFGLRNLPDLSSDNVDEEVETGGEGDGASARKEQKTDHAPKVSWRRFIRQCFFY